MSSYKQVVLFGSFGMLASCGASSEAPGQNPQDDTWAPQAIMNGENVRGKKGVIEFGTTVPSSFSFNQSCTGIMIGPYHALTAAHCTDQARARVPDGVMRRTVAYFDPVRGLRDVTPFDVDLYVSVLSTWDNLHDTGTWNPLLPVDWADDLALVYYPEGWAATTAADWSYVWTGDVSDARAIELYGAGAAEDNGRGTGVLRRMPISLEDFGRDGFEDEHSAQRACTGDSGGPYLRDVSVPGQLAADWAVFGVQSSGELDDQCTEDGGEVHGTRVNAERFQWISDIVAQDIGTGCTLSNSLGKCF